jgi:WD40 repeat protein
LSINVALNTRILTNIYTQVHEDIFISLLQEMVQQNGYIAKGNGPVSFSPKDNNLVACGDHCFIKLVSIDTGTIRKMWYPVHGCTTSLDFSPQEGTILAAGFDDGTVMVFDVETGKDVCTLRGHTSSVSLVAFSPHGKLVASGSEDNTVRIWDVAKGKQAKAPLAGITSTVSSVVFSPDGKLVASGSWDSTVRIWDVAGHGSAEN